MNGHSIGKLARRWVPLLLLGTLLGGLAGFLVVTQIPPVYEATVTLVVQPDDAQPNGIQDLQAAQDLAATYAEAIHTRTILVAAAAQVGLDGLPERELEKRVQATRVTGTALLRVSVDDTDPTRAAQFANTVAQVFVSTNSGAQASRYASSLANLSQLVNQLQTDIDSRIAVINGLNAQPASPERDSQVFQLENNLAQVRTTYGNTRSSYEELRVSEARGAGTVTIFDPAVEPPAPVRPSRALTTLLAALAGLAVTCGALLLREYFDDHLDNVARVARTTGLATLGILPHERAPRSLRDANGRASLASYRVLRSRLMAIMHQTGVRSLLVSSAAVGEGKSTVAANLALVLAETGQRVLLMDANVQSPAQMRLFELPNQNGLITLLAAEPDFSVPAVNDTWSPNLKVLTAGPVPLSPGALLSSSRLRHVVDEISTRYDVVLIDGPAVLAEPDSLVLAAHVDAVLLVIDARRSRGRSVARAVENLRSSGAFLVGAIVNRAGKDSDEFVPYQIAAVVEALTNGVGRESPGDVSLPKPTARVD